jgi:hypothetical protein
LEVALRSRIQIEPQSIRSAFYRSDGVGLVSDPTNFYTNVIRTFCEEALQIERVSNHGPVGLLR